MELDCVKKHFSEQKITLVEPVFMFERTIYFFGPCITMGYYCEDGHTIESFLQTKINQSGKKIRVVNRGTFGGTLSVLRSVMTTPLKEKDIVVMFFENKKYSGMLDVNLYKCLERYNVPTEWIWDIPLHVNYRINEIYANEIYDKLVPFINENINANRDVIKADDSLPYMVYIDKYFSDFNKEAYDSIGAIVMNCNPFTNGHRYLIEYALSMVDFLIIFVVEEDKSLFPYNFRMKCVSEGVADLNNIMVVPSGEFLISRMTFPQYFVKIADDAMEKNMELDLMVFATKIAPLLNVKVRFVGEEPNDSITEEYNRLMKKVLPENGIKVIEIPRFETGEGDVISATTVRQALVDENMELLDELVPETTKRLLIENMARV